MKPISQHGYFTLVGKNKFLPLHELTLKIKPIPQVPKPHSGDACHGKGCRKWQQKSLGILGCYCIVLLRTEERLRSQLHQILQTKEPLNSISYFRISDTKAFGSLVPHGSILGFSFKLIFPRRKSQMLLNTCTNEFRGNMSDIQREQGFKTRNIQISETV